MQGYSWLVGWFKRYILLGPRAGALTLLQGIWGPVDLFRGPPGDMNPGPRRGRQVSYLHASLLPMQGYRTPMYNQRIGEHIRGNNTNAC